LKIAQKGEDRDALTRVSDCRGGTYIIVEVKKRLTAFGSDFEFNLSLAPNVLGVKCVYFVARLHIDERLPVKPGLVGLDAVQIPLHLVFVARFRTLRDHEFDCTVDDVALLEDPLADILATIRTLSAMDQRLVDASFAEGVSADRCAARDDVVHTNRAVQLVDRPKRLLQA